MRRTRRYSLQIKDAKGSIVFAAAAVWDGDDWRVAVAKILRLDGVLEAPSFRQYAATDLDVERMAASFAIATAAKKKPRH